MEKIFMIKPIGPKLKIIYILFNEIQIKDIREFFWLFIFREIFFSLTKTRPIKDNCAIALIILKIHPCI